MSDLYKGTKLPAYQYSRHSRLLTVKDFLECVVDAWGIFKLKPFKWILLSFFILALGFAMRFLPYVGFVFFLVFLFFFYAGFSYCAHRQFYDGDFAISDIFIGFKYQSGLLAMIALIAALVLVINFIVSFLFAELLGVTGLLIEFAHDMTFSADREESLLILVWCLFTSMICLPIIMGTAFSSQLILLRSVDPLKAFTSSFNSCVKSGWALLCYMFVLQLVLLLSYFLWVVPYLVVLPVTLITCILIFKKMYLIE